MEKPEVPLEQTQEEIVHRAHGATEPWIMGVALTAAILAVLAAITSLLAEHHANEAMIKQIQCSDQWAYYQAKGIKANVLTMKVELLPALGKSVQPHDEKKLDEYREEQKGIRDRAEELQNESESHLRAHIPLSFGVTMFQVAIAIGAVSVLTKRKAFWYVAIAFGVAGVLAMLLGAWMPGWFSHLLSGSAPHAGAL